VTNFDVPTAYDAITGDFQAAWDALAAVDAAEPHRGNYMFCRQAMMLLEWMCRLTRNAPKVRDAFGTELKKLDARYFTPLPGVAMTVDGEFRLPGNPFPKQPLIWLLFDLVRHGQAHQYDNIILSRSDGNFDVGLSGARHGLTLNAILEGGRDPQHLAYRRTGGAGTGDLVLRIGTGQFFLDLRDAADAIRPQWVGLRFRYLTRPRAKQKAAKRRDGLNKKIRSAADFTLADLEAQFQKHRHPLLTV
jgi:hypothetical protein